jgi:hypothetical protein
MSNALRRKLDALREMTTARGCTVHEAAAARAAELRIARRLGVGLDELEPPEQYPVPPQRRRTRGRRKTATERPAQHRLHIGDVIDLDCTDHPVWGRCKCGSSTAQVMPGLPPIAVAWLMCCKCRRSRKLTRAAFEGARWRQD